MRININYHFKDKLLGCIPIIIKPKPTQMTTIKSRSRSSRYQRQYSQLQQARTQLNHQLTITSTQFNFSPLSPQNQHKLPSVFRESIKPKQDRYTSEKIRYQNNLRNILIDIKKKIDGPNRIEANLYSSLSTNKGSKYRTIPHSNDEDFRIKPISLSPLNTYKQEMTRSYALNKQEALSARKYQKEERQRQRQRYRKQLRKSPVERFNFDNFQPWNTIEELELHSLNI